MYYKLTQRERKPLAIYNLWFYTKYPGIILNPKDQGRFAAAAKLISPENKFEFYKALSDVVIY